MTNVTPPGEGWTLRARCQVKGDKIYNAGCEIPAEKLGKNLAALLRIGNVWWAPPGQPAAQQSRELPVPEAAPVKHKVHILMTADADPIESWKRTKARMIRLCNGNRAHANDLLMGDQAARDLYRAAQKLACYNEAQRRNVPSVSPDKVGL